MGALTTVVVVLASYLILPVTGVQVVGARMFPESEAWDAVPDRASLLTLNTATLEDKIESNPWVESATVTENRESGIVTVEVEERRAVLDAEMEGERVILASDGERLPGLGGVELERVELEEDVLRDVVGFTEVLDGEGVRLDSIDGVGPGGIEATVEGRRVIFSGDVSVGQARALEGVMAEHPGAQVFDLRAPERVVVGQPSGAAADGGDAG